MSSEEKKLVQLLDMLDEDLERWHQEGVTEEEFNARRDWYVAQLEEYTK